MGLGGAVFAVGSSLILNDVQFWDHSAWSGGALAIINGTGLLSSSSLAGCVAYEDGGAVQLINSTLTMVASNATSNIASRNGGAIHAMLLSTVIASGSSFSLNRAGTFTGTPTLYFSFPGLTINRGNGGAVHVEFSSVLLASQGTRCSENEAEWAGGCISAFQECGVQLWDDVRISDNVAGATLDGGRGGGVSVLMSGLAAWQGVHISDNTVGPPYVYGPDWLGGGVLAQAAVVSLSYGVTVNGNYATVGGGILGVGLVQAELHHDVEVAGNTAFVTGGGMLVWIDSAARLRDGVRVRQNTLVVGDGAGINVRAGNLTLGEGVAIEGNVGAGQTGGTWEPKGAGIMLEAATMRVTGAVTVAGNSIANGFGAGVSTNQIGCLIVVEGALTVADNFAEVSGGGMRLGLNSALVNHGRLVVRGNIAGARGGGVFAVGSELELGDAEYVGNAAGTSGGGLALIGGARTACEGCVLRGNEAGSGGGMAVDSSPVRVLRAEITGNRAGTGGGIVAVGAAEVELAGSRVEGNVAESEGGGVASYDAAVLRVKGGVRFEGNIAGERGGGLLVSGGRGEVEGGEGGVQVVGNTAGLQGGGVCYTTEVEVRGGEVQVEGNEAGGEGGGVCGIGWKAELVLGGGGRARVAGNNATDGGGVALMGLARLRVAREECASSCVLARNNSVCNMECMSAGCDWDGGDCNERFASVALEARLPCDRFRCPLQYQDDPGKCPVDCLWASCDFAEGNPNCQPFLDAMARCPLWDAVTLRSLEEDPTLVFVKEGGTARGWGRCVPGGCNASAHPPLPDWCTAEECAASGSAGEGWCRVVDDDSRVLQYSLSTEAYSDIGEAWGVCSDRPRLPLAGFEYDAAALAGVLDLSMAELLESHAGCGAMPLTVEGNLARRNGGGLYKSSCNLMLHRQDECFVEGLRGSVLVSFTSNEAQAAGGGVFVACHQTGACGAASGLPLDGDRAALSFSGNSAGTYGEDVASGPKTLRVEAAVTEYRPGQDQLDLEVVIEDGAGQVLKAEEESALPLLVSVGVCASGADAGSCTSTDTLQPEGFFTLQGGKSRVSLSDFGVELQFCEEGSAGLSLLVSVRGTGVAELPSLQLLLPVACLPCQEGQRRETQTVRGREVWTCRTCGHDSYILSSSDSSYECQPCPPDLTCRAGEAVRFGHAEVELALAPDTLGALSAEDISDIAAAVVGASADPLHVRVLERETQGSGLAFKAESAAQGSSALIASLSAAAVASSVRQRLERMGRSVDGFRLEVLPAADVVGEYEVQGQQLVLVDCEPGFLLVNASLARQRCVPCEPLTYALVPLEGCHGSPPVCEERACLACPVGADCVGRDSFEPEVAGSIWLPEERYMAHGDHEMRLHREMRVHSCPVGYVLVRGEKPELDSCATCLSERYSLVEAVVGGSLQVEDAQKVGTKCHECPHNARCEGAVVTPKAGYWLWVPPLETERRNEGMEATGQVELYRCPVDACEADGHCAEGREGPVCALCAAGYAKAGTECIQCEDFDLHAARITTIVVLLVVLAIVWYYAAWRPYFVGEDPMDIRRAESGPESAPQGASWLTSLWIRTQQLWNRFIFHLLQSHYLAYSKVFISFWQVASTFRTNFLIKWPSYLSTLWKWTAVLRFNFVDLPAPACMLAQYEFVTILQGYTLTPIILAAFLAVPTLILIAQRAQNSETYRRVHNAFAFSVAFLAFLLYPMLSMITTSTFKCQEVAGEWHFFEDFSVKCPWKEPGSLLFIWGLVFTLLFPFGIPVLVWWMLHRWRVPAMAREKQDRAVLERMVWLHKLHADEALTAQIASYMGGLDAVAGQDSAAVIRQRAQQFYDGATKGGRHALTTVRMLEYCHKIGLIGREEEVSTLFGIFHDDSDASLSCDEFVDFIFVVEEQERRVAHFTDSDAIPDTQLEDMCSYDWNLLCRNDDEDEGVGMEREMKRRLKKRFRHREASTSALASKEVATKYSRAVRKRSAEGSFNSNIGPPESVGGTPLLASRSGARAAAPSVPAARCEAGTVALSEIQVDDDLRVLSATVRPEETPTEDESTGEAAAGAASRARVQSSPHRQLTIGSAAFVSVLNKVSSARAARRNSDISRRVSSGGHAYDEFHVRRVVERCPLGPEAVRDERIAWLVRTGRRLRGRGYLESEPLRWLDQVPEEREAMDKVGFLFDAYKVDYWYYELVEMFRKFIMTGVVGLMFDSSLDQLTAAFVVTSVALLHFVRVQPYTSMMVNHLQTCSLTVQAATLLYGLLIQYRSLQEQLTGTEEDAPVASAIIIILNSLIFALPPIAVFHEEGHSVTTLIKKSCCGLCCRHSAKRQDEQMDTAPRTRQTDSFEYRSLQGRTSMLRSAGASLASRNEPRLHSSISAEVGFVSKRTEAAPESGSLHPTPIFESSQLLGTSAVRCPSVVPEDQAEEAQAAQQRREAESDGFPAMNPPSATDSSGESRPEETVKMGRVSSLSPELAFVVAPDASAHVPQLQAGERLPSQQSAWC